MHCEAPLHGFYAIPVRKPHILKQIVTKYIFKEIPVENNYEKYTINKRYSLLLKCVGAYHNVGVLN